MKENKSLFLYGIVALFTAYCIFSTFRVRKLETRLETLEKQLTVGPHWVASTR